MVTSVYRIVTGYSLADLEKNVNFVLSSVNVGDYIGSPQVIGHSEYAQALEIFVSNTEVKS